MKKKSIAWWLFFVCLFLPGLVSAQVVGEWTARYDGLGNADDVANAIAVDGSGNVYVTGWSIGSDSSTDIVTIKYDSQGNEKWKSIWDSGEGDDEGTDLTVDDQGNVYVTGWRRKGAKYAFITIKYNDQGVNQWDRRYDARFNGPLHDPEWRPKIAVDSNGDVYVTGPGYNRESSNSNYDYVTIKYDGQTSVTIWENIYNGPPGNGVDRAEDITIDSNGYIYVTGKSRGVGTDDDCLTIKYDADGNQLWEARYNNDLINGRDGAHTIVVDNSGYAYIAGWSWGGASNKDDVLTVKYDADTGDLIWASTYNYDGPDSSGDEASTITFDSDGNVYVTGVSDGGDSSYYDFVTIKYDSSGNELWVNRYDGPGNNIDWAYGIAIDSDNNIYVTGESVGSDSGLDYATIKYDTDGTLIWIARENGPGNGHDYANGIALDSNGNVYVAGGSEGTDSSLDYFTIKYNKDRPMFVNRAPVADDQSVSTDEDTPVGITLTGSDPDGDSLTYSVESQPTHGSLSGTAPDLTYTPEANYYGADSFSFKVNDGQVDSGEATVSITVNSVNDPPVLGSIGDKSVAEGQLLSFTVSATDPDGDSLSYSAGNLPSGASFDSYSGI
jgi:uncharacterized delta-60 repeat protein